MEIYEVVVQLETTDCQSLIIPITAFMAKETAAMVCKAMSDSLKERISKVTVSDSDSLLLDLGIENVTLAVREMNIEMMPQTVGGIVLPGAG